MFVRTTTLALGGLLACAALPAAAMSISGAGLGDATNTANTAQPI